MGNAPSIAELPPEWEEILPDVTREDILRSSRRKCRVETIVESEDSGGGDGNAATTSRVYLHDEVFDLDEHVPLALAILRSHPHLKDVRFKLVPGRLTEELYWAALFGILRDGGLDDSYVDEVVGVIDDDYETGDEVDDSRELGEGDLHALMSPPQSGDAAVSPALAGGERKNGRLRTPIANLGASYAFVFCLLGSLVAFDL